MCWNVFHLGKGALLFENVVSEIRAYKSNWKFIMVRDLMMMNSFHTISHLWEGHFRYMVEELAKIPEDSDLSRLEIACPDCYRSVTLDLELAEVGLDV